MPSNRTFHHGMIAIVGRLVVLSGFLVVCGVTSTPAQTGQDARCAGYSGQAHGLCTAAVSEGCFDGVQSPDCEALTATWNERCRQCEGAAPWEPVCPCVEEFGRAVDLNALFLEQTFEGEPWTACWDNDYQGTLVIRADFSGACCTAPILDVNVDLENAYAYCRYEVRDASDRQIAGGFVLFLLPSEIEACRADIRALQALPGVCP
jgi:hypothetical protein